MDSVRGRAGEKSAGTGEPPHGVRMLQTSSRTETRLDSRASPSRVGAAADLQI